MLLWLVYCHYRYKPSYLQGRSCLHLFARIVVQLVGYLGQAFAMVVLDFIYKNSLSLPKYSNDKENYVRIKYYSNE